MDGRFILIGLIAVIGDPVMHIITFDTKELSFERIIGRGIHIPYDEFKNVRQNYGAGKHSLKVHVSRIIGSYINGI